MTCDIPRRPAALTQESYDKIVHCVSSGSPDNREKRQKLATTLLVMLAECSSYAECRRRITEFCRAHASACPGDEIEPLDQERFGSLRSLYKFAEAASSGAGNADGQLSAYRVLEIVTILSTGIRGSREWEVARADYTSIAGDAFMLPVISPYPLWLMRRPQVVPDLFEDIKRECLPYWLAIPRASRQGKWVALNLMANALHPRPTKATFLDGFSIEEDIWMPGGFSYPVGPPESACDDERFARGIEECIRHDPVPIGTIDIDHLYIIDGAT